MGTKIEYVDSSHMYATNYIRNSKAIAVLWAIFTICYTIISVVAFVTPGEGNKGNWGAFRELFILQCRKLHTGHFDCFEFLHLLLPIALNSS